MAMNIRARYASAVHSKNLTVKSSKNNTEDAVTVIGDPEILGAYGLADRDLERGHDSKFARGEPGGRNFSPAPLAVPLERLFSGDAGAVHDIVRILADMAVEQSYKFNIQITRTQAQDMGRSIVAWFRHGVCKHCGGRGKPLIEGTPVMSPRDCKHCRGSGKIAFDRHFIYELKPLARWLRDRMDAESGRAGPNAMRALAAKMEL